MVATENTKLIICREMRGLILPSCTHFWQRKECAFCLCCLITQGKTALLFILFFTTVTEIEYMIKEKRYELIYHLADLGHTIRHQYDCTNKRVLCSLCQ